MPSRKALILDRFARTEFDRGILNFDDVLIDVVEHALGMNRIEAEAYVEADRRRVWNYCSKQADDDRDRGLEPWFVIRDVTARRFAWAPWALIDHSSYKTRKTGLLLQSRPQLLLQIDALNDRQYEAVSCLVLKIAGASEWVLTPCGNEGGIDAMAKVALPGKTHVFSGIHAPARVVAQCKKYAGPVDVSHVEQFITTLSNIRHRSPRVNAMVPAWFQASYGPIIGWMVSHRGFQRGAREEAKSHGIIVSDSRDLVEIIARARTFYSDATPSVRASRLPGEIDNFLLMASAP